MISSPSVSAVSNRPLKNLSASCLPVLVVIWNLENGKREEEFKLGYKVTPCPHNPLGVKGCGEAGAIAAPAAVMNAVHDALAPLGVTHVPMPATPLTVWQAINGAQRQAAE